MNDSTMNRWMKTVVWIVLPGGLTLSGIWIGRSLGWPAPAPTLLGILLGLAISVGLLFWRAWMLSKIVGEVYDDMKLANEALSDALRTARQQCRDAVIDAARQVDPEREKAASRAMIRCGAIDPNWHPRDASTAETIHYEPWQEPAVRWLREAAEVADAEGLSSPEQVETLTKLADVIEADLRKALADR